VARSNALDFKLLYSRAVGEFLPYQKNPASLVFELGVVLGYRDSIISSSSGTSIVSALVILGREVLACTFWEKYLGFATTALGVNFIFKPGGYISLPLYSKMACHFATLILLFACSWATHDHSQHEDIKSVLAAAKNVVFLDIREMTYFLGIYTDQIARLENLWEIADVQPTEEKRAKRFENWERENRKDYERA
jgi:hypothetical protein